MSDFSIYCSIHSACETLNITRGQFNYLVKKGHISLYQIALGKFVKKEDVLKLKEAKKIN